MPLEHCEAAQFHGCPSNSGASWRSRSAQESQSLGSSPEGGGGPEQAVGSRLEVFPQAPSSGTACLFLKLVRQRETENPPTREASKKHQEITLFLLHHFSELNSACTHTHAYTPKCVKKHSVFIQLLLDLQWEGNGSSLLRPVSDFDS